VRAPELESLYDSAKALSTVVPPQGNRLLIVISSGGAGILAVDEAEPSGLSVPPLPRSLVEELQGSDLPPTAVLANPLDLTMSTAADFDAALSAIVHHDIADVYLLVFGDPIPGATDVARRLRDVVGRCVAVAYLGGAELEKAERVALHAEGIPVFPTPERAVRAIGDAGWLGRFRSEATLAGELR
jgi:acyl-CoA synthetase (NDP forming)